MLNGVSRPVCYSAVWVRLLEGGVPGVIAGCLLARRVPARKLKFVIAAIAIFAGLQLVWSGSRTIVARRSGNGTPAESIRVASPGPVRSGVN